MINLNDGIAATSLTAKQQDELNACWKLEHDIYKNLPLTKWESVKSCAWISTILGFTTYKLTNFVYS